MKSSESDVVSVAHTPGPWSADKWATGYTVSAPESHYSVCHLEGCNNDEANARLIAAAPDLLEACKVACYWLETPETSRATGNDWRQVMDQLRAAIDRATTPQKEGAK